MNYTLDTSTNTEYIIRARCQLLRTDQTAQTRRGPLFAFATQRPRLSTIPLVHTDVCPPFFFNTTSAFLDKQEGDIDEGLRPANRPLLLRRRRRKQTNETLNFALLEDFLDIFHTQPPFMRDKRLKCGKVLSARKRI